MLNTDEIRQKYFQDGYYFPLEVMSDYQAQEYRRNLEDLEERYNKDANTTNASIWFTNANFVLPFVDEITRLPTVLEPVKSILGEDVLVWNASFFIKEPKTPDFVSWHQDLKYWGLSNSQEVTAWIALSPATMKSGCMRFIQGSHKTDLLEHTDSFVKTNMLSRGQELAVEVDENKAIEVELERGNMSLHHGHIFHASNSNQSDDRRIGLAIRYISPTMHQHNGVKPYAHLVSGKDTLGHFQLLSSPKEIMADKDIAVALENIKVGEQFFYQGVKEKGKRAG